MKIKAKLILLTILCMTAVCAFAAGCSVGPQSYESFVSERGLNCIITYYSNGGSFSSGRTFLDVYTRENQPVLEIGVVGKDDEEEEKQFKLEERPGYVLVGWYQAVTDADGNPVFVKGTDDEGKEIVTSDVVIDESRPVNFSAIRTEAGHRFFGAKWEKDSHVEIKLINTDPVTINGVEYNKGDVINIVEFGKNTSTSVSDASAPDSDTHNFLRFYKDENASEIFSGSVEKPTDGTNVTIYAEYLDKSWTIVKTASNVRSMFAGKSNQNNKYYIFNDIDCDKTTVTTATGNFAATIAGNGHTISNLTFEVSLKNGNISGILGETVTSTAKINDLTLSNVTYKVSAISNAQVYVYLLYKDVESGADFEGFKIEGIKEELKYPTGNDGKVMNLQKIDGEYLTTTWICEGENEINLSGAKLYIDGEQIV